MKLYSLVGAAILGAIILSGCAESRAYHSYREEVDSPSYVRQFGRVWKDWALDATDVLSLELGGGETIGINVQPTELLQAGFLFGDVMKLGWRNRGAGFYREVHKEGGISWMYYRDMRFEPITGTATLFERPRLFRGFPIRFNDEWHWMDLRAEVGLVFVQASAAASPKQALDFVLSTVLLPVNLFVRPVFNAVGARMPEIDMGEDDTAARIRRKYEVELIRDPEIFQPVEKFDELIRLPN